VKRSLVIVIPFVLLIVFAGYLLVQKLTRQTVIPVDAPFSITLERTPCFGRCPVYRISVDGNGRVTYFGEMFVAVEGGQTAQLTHEQIRRLARELERVDFFSLQDMHTDMSATDMPSAITTLRLDGETKTITHYYGDFSAPDKLTTLENLIDEVTNAAQWVEPTVP
jgi:hypothetical protein